MELNLDEVLLLTHTPEEINAGAKPNKTEIISKAQAALSNNRITFTTLHQSLDIYSKVN